MPWESWTAMYNRWLNCLAERNIESFFMSSYENSREMRTTYTTLGNVQMFTDYLKRKADEESLGIADGEIPMSIGGY